MHESLKVMAAGCVAHVQSRVQTRAGHITELSADWFFPPITLGQRLVFNNRLGQTHHHHQTLPVSCQRLWW